jgi:hypothetical protein
LIGEFNVDCPSTLYYGQEITPLSNIYMATKEVLEVAAGKGYTTWGGALSLYDGDMLQLMGAPLRRGITYSFQLYAAINRSSTSQWYRTATGAITGASDTTIPARVTVGQQTEDANAAITRIFSDAKTSKTLGRIRFATLSVTGSTATTHVLYSAGEPVLNYIAKVCDLEMGAKTDSSKAVFGINRPAPGSSYDGSFKLRLSVSSSASTAFSLRYPDNINRFQYSPGLSSLRNDVTVIPSTGYLSGENQYDGANIIGSNVSDSASINTYGRIPLIASKAGLINKETAAGEATRMLNTYKEINTKRVSLMVIPDGIDLWFGWDLGDSINVNIKKGLVSVDESFVISGVRWFGESDGRERIELELVQGSAFAAAKGA